LADGALGPGATAVSFDDSGDACQADAGAGEVALVALEGPEGPVDEPGAMRSLAASIRWA
jgi:hypothetical protein